MADIVTEIDTIGDLIKPLASFKRYYKQTLPKVYEKNTFAVRWQGDNPNLDLTAVIYETERPYQILYFGSNELDCLQKAEAIQSELRKHIKVKLRGLDDYITLGPVAFSSPYQTDTDGVYGVVGILTVRDIIARPQPTYPKMQYIESRLYEDLNQSMWEDVEVNPVAYSDLNETSWDGLKVTLISVANETK